MKNVELLRQVAADLLVIEVEAVFFGGTVVGLHLDALPPDDEERPTTDVDCVPLAVSSAAGMRALESKLDRAGWKHVMTGEKRNAYARVAPCGVPVDLVPQHTLDEDDPVRLARRVPCEVDGGLTIQVLSSAGMVAAKLAAFKDRGRGDPLMSHDLEDLAMLLSCCTSLEADLKLEDARLRQQVRVGLSQVWNDTYLLEILDGMIPRGLDAMQVLRRLEQLATSAEALTSLSRTIP